RAVPHDGRGLPRTLDRTYAGPSLAPLARALRPLMKLQPAHISRAYAKALASGRRDGSGGLSARTVTHTQEQMLANRLQRRVSGGSENKSIQGGYLLRSVAQWLQHGSPKPGVGGSSPSTPARRSPARPTSLKRNRFATARPTRRQIDDMAKISPFKFLQEVRVEAQ